MSQLNANVYSVKRIQNVSNYYIFVKINCKSFGLHETFFEDIFVS